VKKLVLLFALVLVGLATAAASPRAGASGVTAPVLTATPVSDTEIDLSWTDAGTEDSYTVREGSVSIASLSADTLAYSVTGLTPDTAYDFAVWAKSGAKWFKSDVVTASTLSASPSPTPSPSESPSPSPSPSPSESPSPSPSESPSASPSPSCSGVVIPAGADTIQPAIDANPSGTTFCLDGTYTTSSAISPSANDAFLGTGAATTNVEKTGTGNAVFAGGVGVLYDGIGIGPSDSDGIRPGSSSTIQNVRIHDAANCGVNATTNFLTVQDSEIDHNGTDPLGGAADCGLKIHGANGVDVGHDNVVDRNYVHDNGHNGVWTDCDAYHNTVSNNVVADNGSMGLDEETSYENTWTGNTVSGNGFDTSWPAAQSLDSIGSSWTDNVFSGNWGAFKVWKDKRGTVATPAPGTGCADATLSGYIPSGITFSNNRMTTAQRGGIAQSTSPDSATFDYNCWTVDTLGAANWILPADTTSTWTQWQAAGQDPNGVHQLAPC
jgi:parallel beta-helix repeat protein